MNEQPNQLIRSLFKVCIFLVFFTLVISKCSNLTSFRIVLSLAKAVCCCGEFQAEDPADHTKSQALSLQCVQISACYNCMLYCYTVTVDVGY